MDDKLRELVSRALDDDLDEVEAAELQRLAERDADVATELAAAGQLRDAVAELARRMEPPAALDAVVEPIRLGPPAAPARVRPLVRWLGAAAAVVFGVTVAVEVARRNPGPVKGRAPTDRSRIASDEDEIFQLAPLPTANPEDRRPLGAADRLLEEQPPSPALPEPEPLEVVGPLPEGPALDQPPIAGPEARLDGVQASEYRDHSTTLGKKATLPAQRQGKSRTEADTAKAATIRGETESAEAGRPAAARAEGRVDDTRGSADSRAQAPVVPVVVMVDGRQVWTGSSSICRHGSSRVTIELRGGIVVGLEDEAGASGDGGSAGCHPEGLVGSALEGIGDGIHAAEIVAGDPP